MWINAHAYSVNSYVNSDNCTQFVYLHRSTGGFVTVPTFGDDHYLGELTVMGMHVNICQFFSLSHFVWECHLTNEKLELAL